MMKIKKQKEQKSVLKKGNLIERKINYLRKTKIDVDSLKEDQK